MHIHFSIIFFSLDVLHPSTPSANSTVSTNPSYPTQGRYPSLGVSPSCAIQGALPLFLSLDVLHPCIPSADSTPGVLIVLQVPIQATQHKDDTLL